MKDEHLSPEEIEGLLGTAPSEREPAALDSGGLAVLKELFCPALSGRAALRDPLFPETAVITGPNWALKGSDELFADLAAPAYIALGEFTGMAELPQIVTLDQGEAEQLARALSGQTEAQALFAAVQNMLVRLFESAASALSTVTGQEAGHSLTGLDVLRPGQQFPFTHFTKEQWFAEAQFTLSIGDQHASLRMYLPASRCARLVERLAGPVHAEKVEETQAMTSNDNHQPEKPAGQPGKMPTVQSVQFSSFDEAAIEQSAPNNLDMLLDIPLQVTVELGRTKRVVKEILEMSQGSIVELDKLAGEPVDILINNKLIAVGEVVVIDENFGVRVTDILSTAERMSKLR